MLSFSEDVSESVLVYNSASPISNDVLKAGWHRRGPCLDTESAGNYAGKYNAGQIMQHQQIKTNIGIIMGF